MKLLVLISFLLSFNAISADSSKLKAQGISENIEDLSSQICTQFVGDGSKVAKFVKQKISLHMKKYENIFNATPTQMIHFLNRNKHYMTCGFDNINYMMESFKHGAYDQLFNVFLFDSLLTDDESLYVDINVISYTKENYNTVTPPKTLLDYMYLEWKDPRNDKTTKREIKDLIEFFEGDLSLIFHYLDSNSNQVVDIDIEELRDQTLSGNRNLSLKRPRFSLQEHLLLRREIDKSICA